MMRSEVYKGFDEYTPIDFVNLIDIKFDEMVGQNSRFDTKWGIWSREMNAEIRTRTNNSVDNTEQVILGLVFGYWIAVSNLLELLSPTKKGVLERFLLESKTKKQMDICIAIRTEIERMSDEYT